MAYIHDACKRAAARTCRELRNHCSRSLHTSADVAHVHGELRVIHLVGRVTRERFSHFRPVTALLCDFNSFGLCC